MKILTICTLKDALVTKYKDQLIYLPLSNEDTDQNWEQLLKQHQPKTIIFGLQAIDEAKLALWRQLQPNDHLRCVRKGTSLHRVDFAAAKKYNVEIMNTAGVNASFVADFVINELLRDQDNNAHIGILGIGDIGKRVALAAINRQNQTVLYNRTHHLFPGDNYGYQNDLLELFTMCSRIAVCLPLTTETKGIITGEHISVLSENAKIVCISPPRVMSESAISILDQRKDIHITFDHVASGLQFITDTLGHATLRENFIFAEKAAAGYECQYAMGEAAILNAMSK